jgi:hypothetical protein
MAYRLRKDIEQLGKGLSQREADNCLAEKSFFFGELTFPQFPESQ